MAKHDDARGDYFEKRAGTNEARFHVVPGDDEKWAIKKEGEDNPVYTTNDRDDAIKEAKDKAKDAGTKAIIHDRHGKIEKQDEYDQ